VRGCCVQVFRQTCVPGRGATSQSEGGGSRQEAIEMDDRRRAASNATPQPVTAGPEPVMEKHVVPASSKSQLIVHCDSAADGDASTTTAHRNNGLRSSTTAATHRDVIMFERMSA